MSSHAVHLPCLALLFACAGCWGLSREEEKALSLYSNQAQYWYDNGRYLQAKQQAERGLQLDDGNYKLNLVMGMTLLQLGGRDNAFRATEYLDVCDSQNIFSSDWRLTLTYGLAWQRQAKFYQLATIEEERRASEAENNIAAAEHKAKAQRLRARMNELYSQAIESFEEVVEEKNSQDVAIDSLQQIYANLGQYDKALEYSEVLVRNANLKMERQQEFLLNPDLNQAAEDLVLETIRKVRRRTAEIRGLRANIFFEQKRYAAAIRELDDILMRLAPSRAHEYFNRAQCREALGDREGAIEDYLTFIRRAPTSTNDERIDAAFDKLQGFGVDVNSLVKREVQAARAELPLPPIDGDGEQQR